MVWTELDMHRAVGQVVNMMYAIMPFGMYLHLERLTKFNSRLELAAKAGISVSTVRALESGQHAPSSLTLTKLLNALKLGEHRRAYFLRLAAEAQIKTVGKSKSKTQSRKSHKVAIFTPIAEEERTMLTEMLGEGWERHGERQAQNQQRLPSRSLGSSRTSTGQEHVGAARARSGRGAAPTPADGGNPLVAQWLHSFLITSITG